MKIKQMGEPVHGRPYPVEKTAIRRDGAVVIKYHMLNINRACAGDFNANHIVS
jgi:hypothetical protein